MSPDDEDIWPPSQEEDSDDAEGTISKISKIAISPGKITYASQMTTVGNGAAVTEGGGTDGNSGLVPQ